jgi:aspartate aminotransferase/aminotransferase
MPKLSEIMVGMKGSGIREINNLSQGIPGVQHMEVGEPLFQTPPHIIEAGCDALRHGYTKYTPNAGIPSLREAIAKRLNSDYGLSLAVGNICVTPGATGALYSSVRALTDIGDEVLIPDPGYPNYEIILNATGAVGRRYRLEAKNNFLPSIDQLETLVTPKTKAMLINTPSNPLGLVFPADLMRDLADFARRKDIFIISDEVYEKIVFRGQHASALSFDTDGRVVGAFSFSKSYSMCGWRVGYAAAAEGVITQMIKAQESYVSCTTAASQKAAEVALNGPQDVVETMRQAYMKNLEATKAILDKYGIEYLDPQGAFYMWLNVRCADSHAFAINLLKECQVALAPGTAFGPSGEGYVRISLVSPIEVIEEGLCRLAGYLAKTRPDRAC